MCSKILSAYFWTCPSTARREKWKIDHPVPTIAFDHIVVEVWNIAIWIPHHYALPPFAHPCAISHYITWQNRIFYLWSTRENQKIHENHPPSCLMKMLNDVGHNYCKILVHSSLTASSLHPQESLAWQNVILHPSPTMTDQFIRISNSKTRLHRVKTTRNDMSRTRQATHWHTKCSPTQTTITQQLTFCLAHDQWTSHPSRKTTQMVLAYHSQGLMWTSECSLHRYHITKTSTTTTIETQCGPEVIEILKPYFIILFKTGESRLRIQHRHRPGFYQMEARRLDTNCLPPSAYAFYRVIWAFTDFDFFDNIFSFFDQQAI